MRAGLALGGLAAASSLGGCALLGIENPYADDGEKKDEPGLVDFEGLEVKLSIEPATWQWSVFNVTNSVMNGMLVVGIPFSAVNNDKLSRVLSSMYCKVYSPDKVMQEDVSVYYGDDLMRVGNMGPGRSVTGLLHVMFRGSGTYLVQFDNLLGRKSNLEIKIEYNGYVDAKPFPNWICWENTMAAIPQGESFDAAGLTFCFTDDVSTYVYDQFWKDSGEAVSVVGIPFRVSNNSGKQVTFADISYMMYSPNAYALADASPKFPDSGKNTIGTLVSNQTTQAVMYFPYEYSANYYCIFNNFGVPVVTSVWLP